MLSPKFVPWVTQSPERADNLTQAFPGNSPSIWKSRNQYLLLLLLPAANLTPKHRGPSSAFFFSFEKYTNTWKDIRKEKKRLDNYKSLTYSLYNVHLFLAPKREICKSASSLLPENTCYCTLSNLSKARHDEARASQRDATQTLEKRVKGAEDALLSNVDQYNFDLPMWTSLRSIRSLISNVRPFILYDFLRLWGKRTDYALFYLTILHVQERHLIEPDLTPFFEPPKRFTSGGKTAAGSLSFPPSKPPPPGGSKHRPADCSVIFIRGHYRAGQ